jgi:hypothetical protein
MADFTTWCVAAEPAHSAAKIFLNAYLGNRRDINQVAVDTSVIGPPILAVLNGCQRWEGFLLELLEELNSKVPDTVKKSKSWPSIPRQLKSDLIRLSTNLRQVGIEVTFGKRTNKGIPVTLDRTRISSKSSSLSSPSSKSNPNNDLQSDDRSDDEIASSPSSLASSPAKSFLIRGNDDSDDSDDKNLLTLDEARL